MKARTFILTIGAALALVAPAARAAHTTQAVHATNGLGCSFRPATAPSNGGSLPKPFYNPLNPRGLQAVRSPGSVATARPLHVTCGGRKIATVVAPNYFQILRDSL